jgi:hypothetical protein
MTTLYLAWQDQKSRQWFPVGRLDADEYSPIAVYSFHYVGGAQHAQISANFLPILGFPEFHKVYRSNDLFPLFRNRLMNPRRPDRPEYLHQLGLGDSDWGPITELSASNGTSRTDSFEVFPPIEPKSDGKFETRFIIHGLRHTNRDSIRRTESLQVGDELQIAFDLNNPAAAHAISVRSSDQYVLGWLPRYLVDGLHQDDAWMVTNVEATVAQVNLDAPLSHRLLIDFSGKLPPGVRPMEDLPQYQPIVTYA